MQLEAESGVRRGRVELLLKQLAVDEVVERVEGGWRATGRAWYHDAAHYAGVVAVRRREADVMRRYTAGDVLFRQGDEAGEMFFILSGRYRLREIAVDLGVGEVVGELGDAIKRKRGHAGSPPIRPAPAKKLTER